MASSLWGLFEHKKTRREPLFSAEPSKRSLDLRMSMRAFKQSVDEAALAVPSMRLKRDALESFGQNHEMYLNQTKLGSTPWDKALKEWALARWPRVRLPYSINNNLKQSVEPEPSRATSLLLLAETFLQVTHFCRSLQSARLDISERDDSFLCVFEYIGSIADAKMLETEKKGLIAAIDSTEANPLKANIQANKEHATLTISF